MTIEAIEDATLTAEPVTSRNNRLNSDARLTNDTASTVTITATINAQVLFAANPDRIGFSVSLAGGNTAADVHIRYYPAATDNLAQGAIVLTRELAGNDNLFTPTQHMTPNAIYTGEISVITELGIAGVVATEY